jgi:predicted lipoprotein with Yx(FWY)xxD motif
VRSKVVTAMVAGALVLALGACGDDDDSTSTADQGSQSDQGSGSASGSASGAVIQASDSDLGEILTTADGLTVYGFTVDSGGTSMCNEGCAAEWPPVTVESGELPDGLDATVFKVTQRSDGSYQLVAGDWPLYTFSGDQAAGDTNGQGFGGVWFAVAPDGELNRGEATAGESDTGTGGQTTEDPYNY